jgi:hypothetical protein
MCRKRFACVAASPAAWMHVPVLVLFSSAHSHTIIFAPTSEQTRTGQECLSCSRHCASEHTIIIAPTGRTHAAQARCERIDTLIRELEKAKTCLDTLNADGCAGTRAEEGGTAGEEKSIAKSSARQDAGDVEAMETETETEIETRMDTEPSLHPGSNPVEVSSTSSL